MARMIELSSLPLQLPTDQARPEYLSAYNIVLDAERHAKERLDTDPLGREEKDNLMFARVTGFLLLELFKERAILTVEPCTSLALEITSSPVGGGTNDLVFRLGQHYVDHFLRSCGFDSPLTSCNISAFLQLGRPPRSIQLHPHTIHAPLSTT